MPHQGTTSPCVRMLALVASLLLGTVEYRAFARGHTLGLADGVAGFLGTVLLFLGGFALIPVACSQLVVAAFLARERQANPTRRALLLGAAGVAGLLTAATAAATSL